MATAMEKQDKLIQQFLRTAKYPSRIPSAVETIVQENKFRQKPIQKPNQSYYGGIGYQNLTQEQMAEIKAKNEDEINNREARKKAKRKAKAAATRKRNAEAKIQKQLNKENAFKAMIAAKAKAQIEARKKA